MTDEDVTKPFVDAIANIRETTKWLLAVLGAIFAAMLGGFQLSALGFSRPTTVSPAIGIALGLVLLVIAVALALALRVMVGAGMSVEELLHDWRLCRVRRYLQTHWAVPVAEGEDPVEASILWQRNLLQEVNAGNRARDDPEFISNSQLLQKLLAIAAWRVALARFAHLKVTMLFLLPVAATAAMVVGTHAEPKSDSAKALDTPLVVTIPIDPANSAVLSQGGVVSGCIAGNTPVLIYRESPSGVSEGYTFPSQSCPQRRLLVLDRQRILKVL
jgi:hypothetical protein